MDSRSMLDLSERCPSCWLPSRALVSRRVVYGWPVVVCGWPGVPKTGRPRMAGGRLRMEGGPHGGTSRGGPYGGGPHGGDPRGEGTTRGERSSADGRGRLRMACPRFTVPDGRRGKMGWIRVLCALAGFRPLWSAARPWSCGSSVV